MSVEIRTKRLTLVPLSERELDGPYVSWLNDREVCRYNSHGDLPYTREMAEAYIASVKDNPACEVYAVYLNGDDGAPLKHIGNVSLQQISERNLSAEIAYLFGDRTCWGKGYATEAGRALVSRAFGEMKLHRLYFGTSEFNVGMQRVGENLGFVREGVMRDAQMKNGKFNDIVFYGKVNADENL